MKLMKLFAAFAVLSLTSACASAVGRIADVRVYDGTERRVLPVYTHEGRHYVVGKPGAEYRIRVRNRTGEDILAVVSVDGVNAVSGETASWEQTGYVLSPYQTYDIAGWRKSLKRVAAFYFTRHQNAYATRTGRPDNVGVIGVAVFGKKAPPEAQLPHPRRRYGEQRESPFPDAANEAAGAAQHGERAAESDSAPSAAPAAARPQEKLGTGHGESRRSPVTYTAFERATLHPQEVIAIHYDTYENLVALGVVRASRLAVPAPFPGQFVPDPY